jgi:hypothetical protein
LRTKVTKIWEIKLQKSGNKNLEKFQKSGNKIQEQKLQKFRNKNYKNTGTKITKI